MPSLSNACLNDRHAQYIPVSNHKIKVAAIFVVTFSLVMTACASTITCG
jgi:hypothetical protein